MQTRSQTLILDVNIDIDIDFDDYIKHWNANKKTRQLLLPIRMWRILKKWRIL